MQVASYTKGRLSEAGKNAMCKLVLLAFASWGPQLFRGLKTCCCPFVLAPRHLGDNCAVVRERPGMAHQVLCNLSLVEVGNAPCFLYSCARVGKRPSAACPVLDSPGWIERGRRRMLPYPLHNSARGREGPGLQGSGVRIQGQQLWAYLQFTHPCGRLWTSLDSPNWFSGN